MPQEIERKFKVLDCSFMEHASKVLHIRQGYISAASDTNTVRVRLSDEQAFITIKGASSQGGLVRSEFEYAIPYPDAEAMLKLCEGRVIEKLRYLVPYADKTWELDVFMGRHEGLIIAEIELESEDESFERPAWLGEEVTGIRAYYNSQLAESE